MPFCRWRAFFHDEDTNFHDEDTKVDWISLRAFVVEFRPADPMVGAEMNDATMGRIPNSDGTPHS